MRELCMAALVTACLVSGLLLRYAPLAAEVTPEKRRVLLISYGVLLLANWMALYLLFTRQGISLGGVQNCGVAFAFAAAGVNLLVIRSHTREQLFIFGIVIFCNFLLMAIPAYIVYLRLQMEGEAGFLLATAIYGLLLVVTYHPMRKLLRDTVEPFLHLDSGSYWNTIWFIPIALFGTIFLQYPGSKMVESLSQLAGCFLTAVVMILMCRSIAADHRQMREKQVMAEHLETQKRYYAELHAKVEEARMTGHDFKHYAIAMTHYLNSDDTEGLRACCVELTQQLLRTSAVSEAGSSVADGVVYHYAQLAGQEDIAFKVQGALEVGWISDMDICVILGNLLDNAIEGCRTIPEDRRIALSITHGDDAVCILAQNTYDGVVKRDKNGVLSRKREKGGGVGLRSVESVCAKYHGHMEICSDDRLFSVNLLLKRQNG